MTSANTSRVKRWYQKKRQDPEFNEEYKKKQRLYYYKRKYNLTEIPDYGLANCKYCNKEFKKSRTIHYFCSTLCSGRHTEKFRKKRKKILKPPKIKIPKTPEQLKLVKKQYRDNYWKKLKDEDPQKYELILEKTREATRKWKAANKTNKKKTKRC